MAKTAQLSIDGRDLPEAVAVAGNKADLHAALKWAQQALGKGELFRLMCDLERSDRMPAAVREIVNRWRQFHALAGCDAGNVTTPSGSPS